MQKAQALQRSVARPAGDWRVLYIIDDAAKLISITRIAHRREVYDR
jgi:mRNA-degrading endonuclease RelE of RelBE toxin-antitoxin system